MCVSRVFGSVSRLGRLFVVGRSSLITSPSGLFSVAVAGSRNIDSASSAWLREQVNKLDPDRHILVSGLARGADTIAHRVALRNGVPQVAVLPSGFDNVYPRSNLRLARDIVEAGGCLVSLLPPEARPSRSSFVARNEIIARIGLVLLVPQCAPASGTMHTVRFARRACRSIRFRRAGAPHLVGVPGCSPL